MPPHMAPAWARRSTSLRRRPSSLTTFIRLAAGRLTSATLLLPTTSWGDNYIAVNAFNSALPPGFPIGPMPTLAIVAHENATSVTIRPTADITAANGVVGTPKGVPATYKLDRGQLLQFTQGAALDGSVIQSSVP